MSVEKLLWLGRKEIAYFMVLGLAGLRVLISLISAFAAPRPSGASDGGGSSPQRGLTDVVALLHVGLAVGALFVTWARILAWVAADITAMGGGTGYWLAHSRAFVRAYLAVANPAPSWWWAGQLLFFVGPLMIWMRASAVRLPRGGAGASGPPPVLAYALLGFLGAISLALALYVADLALRRRAAWASAAASPATLSVKITPMVPAAPAHAALAVLVAAATTAALPVGFAVVGTVGDQHVRQKKPSG